MKVILSKKLILLAQSLTVPLYIVGGAVRDYIINGEKSKDIDLSSSLNIDEIISVVNKIGGTVTMQDESLSFVKFVIDDQKYEYTTFRREKYDLGGNHKPKDICFTDKIEEDAIRRDFTCNAIYYDILNDKYVDLLGGDIDIKNKVIKTTRKASDVFSEDGERLLRLCRFSAELGFDVDENTINSAIEFSSNVKDISFDRVKRELEKILCSPSSHTYSPTNGVEIGLKLLYRIKVLKLILPELFDGEKLIEDISEYAKRVESLEKDKIFALVCNLSFYQVQNVLSRLNYGKKTIKRIENMYKERCNSLK